MSRAKQQKKVFGEEQIELSPEDKRFATPKNPALYRAERLACNTIIDLCSGLGFQSFAFAQTCKNVIAVEKNPDLVAKARKFAQQLGIKNITFYCGDALSIEISAKMPKADIVFCDPERYAQEEHRTLATIQPNIHQLIERYNATTKNIAIEFPPHITGLEFDAEYEYMSDNGALNRLTLYFGSLKTADKSVILLPEKIRIYAKYENQDIPRINTTEDYMYILEPNPAVALSGLFREALDNEPISIQDIAMIQHQKKILLLSKKKIASPFFSCYAILQRAEKEEIVKKLQAINAGNVIIRYSLDPQQYWKERTCYEKNLHGDKQIHLFFFDKAVLCEKL
jgi:SAM-dependent methyltransferase